MLICQNYSSCFILNGLFPSELIFWKAVVVWAGHLLPMIFEVNFQSFSISSQIYVVVTMLIWSGKQDDCQMGLVVFNYFANCFLPLNDLCWYKIIQLASYWPPRSGNWLCLPCINNTYQHCTVPPHLILYALSHIAVELTI